MEYCHNLNKMYIRNFCIIVSVNKSTGMIFCGKQRLASRWSCRPFCKKSGVCNFHSLNYSKYIGITGCFDTPYKSRTKPWRGTKGQSSRKLQVLSTLKSPTLINPSADCVETNSMSFFQKSCLTSSLK